MQTTTPKTFFLNRFAEFGVYFNSK